MVTSGLREEAIALSRQALRCAPGEPDVSIFLIDGRVVAKKLGRLFPIDILSFALPLAPDPGHDSDEIADRSKIQVVAVGMKESELRAQFGAPKLQVPYTFKGHSAEHAIYETSPGKSFGRFTLVDGIVIDFADGGHTSLTQFSMGRDVLFQITDRMWFKRGHRREPQARLGGALTAPGIFMQLSLTLKSPLA
jgi:hypothetical protein